MNRVLIVTYYWPPGSGAGVQRWLKFAKYLPANGWEPVILTVDPAYATYPAIDESLADEIPSGIRIIRTKATDWFRIYKKDKSRIPSAGFAANGGNSFAGRIARFIRGNFFIPDPRKGWNKYALREASRLIATEKISHVITTSPPHSTQLIGLELKKRFPGIKWIADLRDPWTDIYYYDSFFHILPAKIKDARYEKQVLEKADRIITVGKSLKESFSSKLPGVGEKIEIITNGYDEADFSSVLPVQPEIFTISYIGTLSDAYPLNGFIEALGRLHDKGLKIHLRFAGVVSPGQKELLLSKTGSSSVEFRPYVSHIEAVSLMTSSSLLLLIIPDHHSNRSIITGKLFEYLASGRPVLCIGPTDGDAAAILEETSHGKCADYDDAEAICNITGDYFNSVDQVPVEAPEAYSRLSLTKKLASLL